MGSMTSPRTFKLTVAYDGTDFSGWQIQPGRMTIQGWLERSAAKLAGTRVHVVGSGRTDAGVHAIAQVASCTMPRWNAPAQKLATAINVSLPDSILVTDAVDAPDDFHAIRDSVSKRYRYQLQNGGNRNPLEHRYWYRLRKRVDLDAMAEAAQLIVGRKDFACFQSAGAPRTTTVRHVTACDIIPLPDGPWGESRLAIEVQADGFLYNMVRNIVGTLIYVGLGKHPPHWVTELLAEKKRELAGPTAPANGLFLKSVWYGANEPGAIETSLGRQNAPSG